MQSETTPRDSYFKNSSQSKCSRVSLFEQAKEVTSQAAQKAIVNLKTVLNKSGQHERVVQSEESYFDIENDEN